MMKLSLTILLFSCFSFLFGQKIDVEIEIVNHSSYRLESGVLTIDDVDVFTLTDEENHEILIDKGKHHFIFKADELTANVHAPKHISAKNNKIVIYLMDKNPNKIYNISKDDAFSTIVSKHESGELFFKIYGLGANITDEMRDFTKKYNIKFQVMGCVINNTENNLYLGTYLDWKFGKVWRKDLTYLPIGVSKK